jgi:raffinose/stachyose/melibiose transport system permease protein
MSAIRFRVLPTAHEQQAARDKQRRQMNKYLLILLFALPGMLIFTLFVLIPLPQSVYFSLWDWNGLGPLSDFNGVGNYTRLLNHSVFQAALGHSFVLMTLSLVIQLPLALSLALLVGRGKLRGRRLFRIILFAPFVFSEIITASLWRYVLHPDEGLLNMVLGSIIPGYERIGLLANRDTVLIGIFMVITWRYFGFHMILYMAGLQNIPPDLEDAARVDGATEWKLLRHITLPLLGSTIRLTVFLSVLGSFQQFVITWVLTEGGPVNGSELIATYMYKFGIQRFNLGYGSAVAVVLFAITLVFSLGYQRLILRQDYHYEM